MSLVGTFPLVATQARNHALVEALDFQLFKLEKSADSTLNIFLCNLRTQNAVLIASVGSVSI